MSGGGNRKKLARGQGWEEAGAEFYQECYPTTDGEFDVLQRDPKHLATLLPSKQTRAAATIRIRQVPDTRTFRRQTSSRSRRESTVHRRASTAGEVQVSMLPDLSQDISTERATWEEIMQIKAMPVSMAQKKEMKAKIQNEPNLRLQGYEQFKWKRRKILGQMEAHFKELYSKLELWRGDLKRIEGHFGTGVVSYFLFVKWLLFLNLSIFTLVFLFVILPTIVLDTPGATGCDEHAELCCPEVYFNQTSMEERVLALDLVQGTGYIEKTHLFYGFYSNRTFSYAVAGAYTLYYDLPFAYVSITVVLFTVSLIAMVKSAAKGFKERLVEGEGQFYQYCNLIFGGWDFCIHNEKSAEIKHKAIFNEIRACLETERLEEERQGRTRNEKTKLLVIRVLANISVLAVLGACGAAIYFAFDFSTEQLKELEGGGNSTSYLVTASFSQSVTTLFYEFLPSLTIVVFNVLIPFIFKYLVVYEKYSPVYVIRLTLTRTVFLRLSSLLVLYASLYRKVSCEPESAQFCSSRACNTPLCWETYVGQQFYKLLITDFATQVVITFLINAPRAFLAKNVNSKFAALIGDQSFDLPKHVLDVIYSQTLCWFGCFYSPLLPAIASAFCFLMFYVKKFACLYNSKPSSTLYRASRSNSMYMVILMISFLFAALPIAYGLAELLPSKSCGPFRDLPYVWAKVIDVFQRAPDWLRSVAFFASTAGFAVPLFIVLTLMLYYYAAVNSANRHMVAVLKNQLVLEGHDKQFLLDRLSMFIKQQQEQQKRQRHAEMVMSREGDRNSSSN